MTDATASTPARTRPFLGWRAQRRPAPAFAHVLGAAAGAFVVIALVAFIAAIDSDDPRVPGIVLSAVLVVLALAAGTRGPGPLRSAGVTVLVLTVPLLWVLALVGDGGGDRGEVRGILLLTLLSYAALYLLGWTKGRAVFLAGALIVFTSWIAFEVAGSGSAVPFGGSLDTSQSTDGLGIGSDISPGVDTDNSDSTANGVIMVLGIAYLVVGGVLDQRRLSGAATPFVAVGAVAAISGGIGLAAPESTFAAGVVAVLIGAAVGIVGANGPQRRATTWIGVLTVFGGLVAILADIAPSSEAGVGAIALAFALGLGALAWWLAPVLREPDDGNDPADLAPASSVPPPPPPPPATGVDPAGESG
jgi:hypothetical protein